MRRINKMQMMKAVISLLSVFVFNLPTVALLNINLKNLFFVPGLSLKFTITPSHPAYAVGTYTTCFTDSLMLKPEILPTAKFTAPAAYDPITDKAYIFGGFGSTVNSHLSEIIEYTPSTGIVVTRPETLPTPRNGSSAVWDPTTNKAYVFGGYDGSFYNQIIEFSPSTGMLVIRPETLPTGRDGTSAVWDPVNNKAYIFGGFGGSYLNEIVEYTPSTGMVVLKSETLPVGIYCTSAIWDTNTNMAYIFGGYNGTPQNKI